MMLSRMIGDDKKVVFDNANSQFPEARLYKRVPFLFWHRWSFVSRNSMRDYWTLMCEEEIINKLLEKESYKIRRKEENDKFNSGKR